MESCFWVIEKPQLNGIVTHLIGDFAIQAFSSYEAFWFFRQVLRPKKCSAIIVNRMDFDRPDQWVFSANPVTLSPEAKGPPIVDFFKDRIVIQGDLDIPTESPILKLKSFLRDILEPTNKPFQTEGERYVLDSHQLICRDRHLGTEVSLTLKEVRLLGRFLETPQECVSRTEIMSLIWPDTLVTPRTLDCHISRLRKKIQKIGLEIEAIYGDGYCLGDIQK